MRQWRHLARTQTLERDIQPAQFFRVVFRDGFGGMRAMVAMTFQYPAHRPFFPARGRQQHLRCANLVNHVDCLVRQFAVGHIARRQLHSRFQRIICVADFVKLLEIAFQPCKILMLSGTLGSLTSIFWNLRASARSFSKCWRNSL